MTDEKRMKQCPFCGEEILEVAIKCKHCGSSLSGEQPTAAAPSTPPAAIVTKEAIIQLVEKEIAESGAAAKFKRLQYKDKISPKSLQWAREFAPTFNPDLETPLFLNEQVVPLYKTGFLITTDYLYYRARRDNRSDSIGLGALTEKSTDGKIPLSQIQSIEFEVPGFIADVNNSLHVNGRKVNDLCGTYSKDEAIFLNTLFRKLIVLFAGGQSPVAPTAGVAAPPISAIRPAVDTRDFATADMVKCKHCNELISKDASRCPKCGAKLKAGCFGCLWSMSKIIFVLIGIGILIIIFIISSMNGGQ